MKKIVKSTEPKSLTSYRSIIPQSDLLKSHVYEDFKEKTQEQCKEDVAQNLRKQLLEEQGYICCYCMSRIDCYNSKIEHFKPQMKHRGLQIDYQNLFIACSGGEGEKFKHQFCDTKKGEDELFHVDLLLNMEEQVTYVKSAKNILIKAEDKNLDSEINRTLNLNVDVLQKNRKETYNSVMKNLRSKGYTISNIQKVLAHYKCKHDDKFEPYNEMVIYFLTKKLHSKGVK